MFRNKYTKELESRYSHLLACGEVKIKYFYLNGTHVITNQRAVVEHYYLGTLMNVEVLSIGMDINGKSGFDIY